MLQMVDQAHKQRFYFGPQAEIARKNTSNLRLSFEFFPPKNKKMHDQLWQAIEKLVPLSPHYVSVTYGAGGSTRSRTHKTVRDIITKTGLDVAAHLTCVGAQKSQIDAIAEQYWEDGVRHIVALRGDPAEGVGERYSPTPGGYPYASDLVAGLKKRHDFKISVAVYPERHPESADWRAELDNLKRKIDAGADQAITQFFFEPEYYARFRDRCADAGISIPLIPGLMPILNFQNLIPMAQACGATVPAYMRRLFDGLENDRKSHELISNSLVTELASILLGMGCEEIHLYTLNRSEFACAFARYLAA